MCVCVVSVIVKLPVLPPIVVDGRSRNPLYYYYFSVLIVCLECSVGRGPGTSCGDDSGGKVSEKGPSFLP